MESRTHNKNQAENQFDNIVEEMRKSKKRYCLFCRRFDPGYKDGYCDRYHVDTRPTNICDEVYKGISKK